MARKGGKYLPLTDYLINSSKILEELSYDEIESILNGDKDALPITLPLAAYIYAQPWWSNGSLQSHYWLEAGWKTYKMVPGEKIVFIRNNVNAEAIIRWTKVIDCRPNFALAYVKRGNAYAEINQMQEAIRDLEKALSLDLSNNNREQVKKKLRELHSCNREALE
jgi:tetratricopeptide (TPR) repeat protein